MVFTVLSNKCTVLYIKSINFASNILSMSNSIKNMLVIITAFLIGGAIMYLGEALIHRYHPFFTEGQALNVDALPAGILTLILLFHAIGAFASGLFLKKFIVSADSFIITLVGLGWTLVGVVGMIKTAQPVWFAISDTCIYLPMTLLGSKCIQKRI